ncbi:hypothetical protein [Streptomyces sparsus]
MLDDGNGNYHAPASSDLKRTAEALKDFRKRVDDILRNLEKSAAAPTRLADQSIPPGSFGSGFSEAEDLALTYERVRTHLTNLSRTFGDQIEAMGIAVQGADIGFDNLEEDVRRRFWEIQERTTEQQQVQQSIDGAQGTSSGADTKF